MDANAKQILREHILDGFGTDFGWENNDKLDNLKHQLKSFNYLEGAYKQAVMLVEGGKWLCYYSDVNEFLSTLKGVKVYKDNNRNWQQYIHLISKEIEEMVTE